MAYRKCDWCGRTYKVGGISGLIANDMDSIKRNADKGGFGLVFDAAGGIARLAGKRNFCGEACKRAYKEAHGK